MLLRLPVDEDLSEFEEGFIKVYNQKNSEECFLEVDIQYPDELHELYNDLLFYQKEWKLKRPKRPKLIYTIKRNKLFTWEV